MSQLDRGWSLAAGFLVLLVLAWVAVCLPAAVRARNRGPLESTALFKRGLELIGPDHPQEFGRSLERPTADSPRPKPLVIRRAGLVFLLVLVAAAIVTAGFAVVEGIWELHLAADAALALFVSWLIEDKHRRSERKRKVRRLRVNRPEELRLAAGER